MICKNLQVWLKDLKKSDLNSLKGPGRHLLEYVRSLPGSSKGEHLCWLIDGRSLNYQCDAEAILGGISRVDRV